MIKIENLKKTYDKGSRHANEVLHGLSLTLPDTGFVCILGASGCGKTSLLNAIGGLDPYDSGTITTDSAKITRAGSREMERERNAAFGYIFQNYYLLSEHSAAYNVFIGMHSLPLSRKDKMARVKDALERVDMLRYKSRPVGELSGGQQQRVAIARAIARRPRVIFADEPTGNLDQANTMNICSILKQLSKDSLVVMVTHEQGIARFFADRIITLDAGNIVSDTTDWERTAMDAGAKDTLYAGDFTEHKTETEHLSLRLLQADDAAPVKLTVVAEKNRIVIKVDDPRIVLCSEPAAAPVIAEGARPILDDANDLTMPEKSAAAPAEQPLARASKGLGLGMLMREARSLVSGKKLRKFGTGVFIVLLSLMLSISVADVITVAHVNPEDFITTDSHVLSFSFERGMSMTDKYASTAQYIEQFRRFWDESELDFDYIPQKSASLLYTEATVPQYGDLSLRFDAYSWANLSRLNADTLIAGRMPERSDEIVLDRWVLEKLLSEDGVLQNIIPSPEYMLGKQLTCGRKTFTLKIVGICDSGEPTMYMSTEAMLALAICGTEVMTRSEYIRITGDDSIPELAQKECLAIKQNTPGLNPNTTVDMYIGSLYYLKQVGSVESTDPTIGAKLIIADETLAPLFASMMGSQTGFSIWFADKAAAHDLIENVLPDEPVKRGKTDVTIESDMDSVTDNLPTQEDEEDEETKLTDMLAITVSDRYAKDMAAYTERTALKLDARTIVTFTVLITAALMLYLMQRSKIRERMDLIAVYRLLGIPKGNLVTVFAIESLLLTLKYALPTVLGVFVAFKVMAAIPMLAGSSLLFPLWAAALTLAAITIFRLLVATLPVLSLLAQPPARLAAKYDF